MDTAVETVVEYVKYYVWNFWRNITGIFNDMSAQRWIRMVAAVGAYLLLRPFLVKLGEKIQKAQYEKSIAASKEGPKAKISPNELRGHAEPAEEEDEEEEAEVVRGGEESGKKARKRQVKQKASTEQEEEDNHDKVMEQLVDYVEGEDGW